MSREVSEPFDKGGALPWRRMRLARSDKREVVLTRAQWGTIRAIYSKEDE